MHFSLRYYLLFAIDDIDYIVTAGIMRRVQFIRHYFRCYRAARYFSRAEIIEREAITVRAREHQHTFRQRAATPTASAKCHASFLLRLNNAISYVPRHQSRLSRLARP